MVQYSSIGRYLVLQSKYQNQRNAFHFPYTIIIILSKYFVISKFAILTQKMLSDTHLRKTSLCYKIFTPNLGSGNHLMIPNQTPIQNQLYKQVSSLLKINAENYEGKSGSVCSMSPNFQPTKSQHMEKVNFNIFNSVKNIGERKMVQVSKLRNISLHNALFIVDKTINLCSSFHHSFGYSNFEILNCKISPDGQLLLTRQCPTKGGEKIIDEPIVVEKIIESLRKICAPKVFDDFHAYYKRSQSKNKCDFKYMHSLIRSYCVCSKITLSKKFQMSEISEGYKYRQEGFKFGQRPISSLEQSKAIERRLTIEEQCEKKKICSFLNPCKSQNKLPSTRNLKILKKSVHISDERTGFNTKMTKSNQITQQFNLKISSHSNSGKSMKNSLSSTNIKTSGMQQSRGDCIDLSITFCDKFGKILSQNASKTHPPQVTGRMPFFASRSYLDKAQSIQSRYEKNTTQLRRIQSIEVSQSDQSQQKHIKQNQQQILEHNHWTRRVENLLISNAPVTQSIIQGKEEQYICDTKLEHLGKLARVVVESYLPNPQIGSNKSVDC